MFTIAQILQVSFPAIKYELLHGREWYSHDLNNLAETSITLKPLGPVVEHNGEIYPVEEITIPLTWTAANDTMPMRDRITLVRNLITNGFASHDLYLEEIINQGYHLIVSTTYRYDLGNVYDLFNDDGTKRSSVVRLHVAYAKIPTNTKSTICPCCGGTKQ